MNDTERLLHDADDSHFLLLSALADNATERGDMVWVEGWRWLARYHRWPIEVKTVTPRLRPGSYPDDPEDSSCWEWWQSRERDYSCSLPRVLMDHVRQAAKTPKGKTCSFKTAGAALACAAFCAGNLIALFNPVFDFDGADTNRGIR